LIFDPEIFHFETGIHRGKNILKIGRFEPSSKLCNCCGNINKELTLKDCEWTCSKCNTLLDRDVNASINIKNFALKNHLSVERRRKNRNELPTLVRSNDFRSPYAFRLGVVHLL
jgi:transposase